MIFRDSRKPLYRHSLKEAVRHEEKDLWRESYKINCDCARAIERIIAENYDGKKLGQDLAEPIIEQYGFNRVNWVLANTVQQKKEDGRISPENRQWAETFPIPQEEHNWQFEVSSHPGLTDLFISDVRKAWQALGLFTAAHCVENSQNQDYTGKLLVLNPYILGSAYQTPERQLFLARDGWGCIPGAPRQTVFGRFLSEEKDQITFFNRSDFIGVLSAEYLPDWAKEKLAAMEVPEAEETPSDGMTLQ